MISRETIAPDSSLRRQLLCLAVCMVLLAGVPAFAKDATVNAIMLFDGPTGPAYVHVTGVLINGKTELRVCDAATKFDKRAYDAMPRAQIVGAASLERNADGVLLLATGTAAPVCVVPSNLKFDKSTSLSPAEAAEQALLQATVLAQTGQEGGALPAFKPGVKLVFVAAPDTELAEYLRAQRANTIAGWRDYLVRYNGDVHANEARNALAAIFMQGAERAFSGFHRQGGLRDFSHLKLAQQQAEQAIATVPGYPAAQTLLEQIRHELDFALGVAKKELDTYRKALAEHTTGAGHLMAAKRHVEQVVEVNAKYSPALSLQTELWQEGRKFEIALQTADSLLALHRYDDALQALGPYLTFKEAPKVEAVVSAVYNYHFNRGQELSGKQDWEHAITEFRAAAQTRESAESTAALKNAETQLVVTRNRQAATAAIAQSRQLADDKQIVEAYDVLANLPDGPRALVGEEMSALSKDYVPAALKRAQKLQEVHTPIRNKADEDAIRQAYDWLSRSFAISGDPAIKLRLDLLADKLGAYYVDVARHDLEKPLGSGVALGWLYLGEAQRFKPDLDVRDDLTKYAPAYQLKARLSVGILLRDQTSRREGAGFADQIADAIAAGLETSGLSIKTVRLIAEDPNALQPSFTVVGEILQHGLAEDTKVETLPSKYRAGVREVTNEAWAKTNQDYEAAQQTLATAQRALADLQAKNKKKEIPAATDAVTAAQKQVDDLHHKLDSTEKTHSEDVIEPYNYARKTIDLNAAVELTFRITDQAGNVLEAATPIKQDNHKAFTVLEGVKPEDSEGVKVQTAAPNETQFMADLETQARDTLVKTVREQVSKFPQKILQDARTRAQQGDLEGAAAQYILYLNATPDTPTSDRDEANKFLHDRFNVVLASATH